jgi:hypothetical protein
MKKPVKNPLRFSGTRREWNELLNYVMQAVVFARAQRDDTDQVLGYTLARLYGRLHTRMVISPYTAVKATLRPEEVHALAWALRLFDQPGVLIDQIRARADQMRLAIPIPAR